MGISINQDTDVPTWTVLNPAQQPTISARNSMDMDIGPIKEEANELDHDELAAVEDLIQAFHSSSSPDLFSGGHDPTTSHVSSRSSLHHSPSDAIISTPASPVTKQLHIPLPDGPVASQASTPPPHSSVSASSPPPHFPNSTPSPEPEPSTLAFPLFTTDSDGAGPSHVPVQSAPKHHKSRVIRALTGNLTTAGQIAGGWAEAINKYLQVMQSITSVDSKEAKRVTLGAKWAIGEMYEACNDAQRDVLKVCVHCVGYH